MFALKVDVVGARTTNAADVIIPSRSLLRDRAILSPNASRTKMRSYTVIYIYIYMYIHKELLCLPFGSKSTQA